LGKKPIFEPPPSGLVQIHEFQADLSKGSCPGDSSGGLQASAWIRQVQAELNWLIGPERGDGLDANARLAEVPQDAPISVVEASIGKILDLQAILGAARAGARGGLDTSYICPRPHAEILSTGMGGFQ
jgi:hypothetical protein